MSIDNKDFRITKHSRNRRIQNYLNKKLQEKQKESKRPIIPKYETEIKIEELRHRRVEHNMIDSVFYPVKLMSCPSIDDCTENDQQVLDLNKNQTFRFQTFSCGKGFLRLLI